MVFVQTLDKVPLFSKSVRVYWDIGIIFKKLIQPVNMVEMSMSQEDSLQ